MRSIADVFPVVATTRTKSIQKQIKSKYPEVGSEKPLASKTCFVLNSSFLDLISLRWECVLVLSRITAFEKPLF